MQNSVLVAREISAERFAAVSALLDLHLAHPAIVLPIDAFVTGSSEMPRYFQIEPKIHDRKASELTTPQPLSDVLAWGGALARGLDYLHQHEMVLTGLAPGPVSGGELPVTDESTLDRAASMIVLVDDEARWLCFDHVGPVVGNGGQESPQPFRHNVRTLAACVLKLATGSSESNALARMPDPVSGGLAQALSHNEGMVASDFTAVLEENRRELAYQEPVRLVIGAQSNVGRVRKLNEDNLFVRDYSDLFAAVDIVVGVVAVADGVGGHSAGDVASRLAVDALADFGESLRRTAANRHMPDPEPWVVQAATAANRAVHKERKAAASDMGCTLVMALFVGSAATLLNVGDSRAYRLRPAGIQQVTTDHSLVQRLIEIGQLTREEARHHPQKSIIYRVIGDTPDLAYDITNVILRPGEALLLCSDGLSDMVEDDVLWHVWRSASSPDEACERLVALANEAGGYDNITVVIAQVREG